MRFQVLSHAGLLVENNGVQVVVDPWLIGSTYWRSWWNYPPPSKEMIAQLKPSFIYLTHIHWDHFQGVSLKRFPYSTPIFAPKGHFGRIKRDLNGLGFQNVTELNHGESVTVGPDLKLTSYTFGLNCDSAVVFEGSGATLLNLNDCKIMGRPLKHLLRRHKRPDFVFCSHSSANSRSCFEIIDDPHVEVDDLKAYIDRFYQFVTACNTRYAVPFASNQCYLHKETFRFNADSRTPVMVKEYWERKGIQTPEIQVLVSGDSWCTENGFQYAEKDWFTDRPSLLLEYQKQNEEKLSEFYRKEERASVSMQQMESFFSKFIKALPFFFRRTFRGHPIVYVLTAGERKFIYHVDVYRNRIQQLDSANDNDHPLQIHTSAYIMRHAMAVNLVADIGIGKRIRYRVTAREQPYARRLISFLWCYQYELIPLRNNLRLRSLQTWALRWRELLLYASLLTEKLGGKELTFEKQLVPLLPDSAVSQPVPKANTSLRSASSYADVIARESVFKVGIA